LKSRFKSPSDNYYLCVLASNGSKAASSLPQDGLVANFPINLSARHASAEGDDPGGLTVQEVVTWVDENLDTEPAIVTGLGSSADEAAVTLTWDKNADPDVFIYQVLRDDLPAPGVLTTVTPSPEQPSCTDNTVTPGGKYTYRVRARNDAGFGGASAVDGMRLLGSPSVSASDGLFPNWIRVQWTPVLGAVSYKIYRAESPAGNKSMLRQSYDLSAAPEWDDYTVAAETSYWYWVQPLGQDDPNGPLGGPDEGFTIVLDPVEASATDGAHPDRVEIIWGADPSATGYNVYRSTDAGTADAVQIANNVQALSFSDTSANGCPWDTPKWYTVRPLYMAVEGPPGQGDFGHRSLARPENVTASQGIDALAVIVSWDAVNNATRYKVYRSNSPSDPTPSEIGEVASPLTSFNDTTAAWDVTEGVHYYYSVAALWAGPDAEKSPRSDPHEGWRQLGIPQNVSATDGTLPDRIRISWDAVSQALHYRIFKDDSFLTEVDAPSTSYDDFDVVAPAQYSYQVSASITDHESPRSLADIGMPGNMLPVADLVINPGAGDAPFTAQLDAGGSTDSDGTIEKYEWDWTTDGTWDFDSGADATTTHEYSAAGEHTCTVRVTDNDGSTDTASAVLYVRSWASMTIDASSNNVGWQHPSLAVVNGNPAVAYNDDTLHVLKYVRANDAAGTSWGNPVPVDNGANTGHWPTLLVVNGLPAISYYNDGTDDLMYVRAVDADGANWGTIVTVAQANDVGTESSMVIVNGRPAIAFRDTTNRDLLYVRSDDTDGTSWPSPIQVDATEDQVGWYPSMAIIAGYPAVAYYDLTNQNPKYVRAADADGSDWGLPITVEAASDDTGYSASLLDVNGYPAFSYYNESPANDLLFIRATDAIGSAWGSALLVDGNGNVGGETSAIVFEGKPSIAYYDYSNGALKYIHADDANGSTWLSPVVVDTGSGSDNVGRWPSMALVDGLPAVAYYDITNENLKYARLQ
jgi:hypothetical protein